MIGNAVPAGRLMLVLVAAAMVAVTAAAGNETNPDAVELAPLPMPVEFKSDMDSPVAFDSTTTVVVDCPDAEAVKAAGYNQLRSLGITDRGAIAAGQIADIVLVDDSLTPQMTIIGGRVLMRS